MQTEKDYALDFLVNRNSYYGDIGYAYEESDGSAIYNGDDGSSGRRECDGDVTYYSNCGESEYYYDGDLYYSSDPTSSFVEEMISIGISGFIAAAGIRAVSKAKIKEEEDLLRFEKEKIRKENTKIFMKKHRKLLSLITITSLIFIVICTGILNYQKLIPINISSNDMFDQDYNLIIDNSYLEGFTNVSFKELNDLEIDELENEDKIASIEVNGKSKFDINSKFPYDCKVIISYHSAKLISCPFSSKQIKGENYKIILKQLEDVGFSNIVLDANYDLITGWVKKDCEIDEIFINGESKFESGSTYRVDSNIRIVYHTFRKN